MEEGVAAGVPRGRVRGCGRLRRVRHRRAVVPDRAHWGGPRRHQGLSQRLPAPRPQAARMRRNRRQGAALRVPRMVVEARRGAQRDPVPVGLPERHARGVRAARSPGRSLRRVRVHQPRPRRGAPRGASRQLPRDAADAAAASSLRRRARGQEDARQLEGVPGGVHGGVPRGRHPPDADGDDG